MCRIKEAYKGDESLDASVVTRYIQKILEGIQYVLNVFVDCIICPPLVVLVYQRVFRCMEACITSPIFPILVMM